VSEAISGLFLRIGKPERVIAGTLLSYISPRLLKCEISLATPFLQPGSQARLLARDGQILALGQVVDDRFLKGTRIATIAITEKSESWSRIAESDSAGSALSIVVEPLQSAGDQDVPAGIVSPGSNIGELHLRTNPDTDLVEGEVLAVELPSKRAYYQIVSATLKQEHLTEQEKVQEVEVVASQLGIWRKDRCRFEPVSWVAPAGGMVARVRSSAPLGGTVPTGHLEIGKVPNSTFPVHVNLDDVVTHNTAILGVTGSGKSYLAFSLIEGLLQANIRVLVLDVSRQHWVFMRKHGPYQVKEPKDAAAWLKSDQIIAIHQFAKSTNYPQTASEMVDSVFTVLEKNTKLRAGRNEPAKLCVVFEEAHSLIPEWNQVSQRGDEQFVNKTARTVLQGRKYGMGCIVISQRTANVTKTILNQCNTIAALQSFDQTGLDFLSNYMGTAYANILSTLPLFHAVLVGKASSSTRPILFAIEDMSTRWTDSAGEEAVPAAESVKE
jgi:hypothetical protein